MIYVKLRSPRTNEFINVSFVAVIQLSYFTLGFSHSKRGFLRHPPKGNVNYVEFATKDNEVLIDCLDRTLKELYIQGWDLASDGCTIDEIRLQPYTIGWPNAVQETKETGGKCRCTETT